MGNTLAPKGFSALVTVPVWWSKNPRSYFLKLTSQIFSLTSLIPTFCPANTVLRLIFRLPTQIRPQLVTVMVRSWKGYSSSPILLTS